MNRLALQGKLGRKKDWRFTLRQYRAQKALFFMILPCVALAFIFTYVPLTGWIMAFEKFKPAKGYFGSEFVGLYQFKQLFTDPVVAPIFWQSFRNTIVMSLLNLIFSFIAAIGFALLLNEVRRIGFKKFTQTISYLPHFLSWMIVCSLITNILSSYNGDLNNLLVWLGIIKKPVLWLGIKEYFWGINTFSNVWKETGWNSIIYIAAMSAIDTELYEACEIDGGNRYTKMWHVTLPGIRPTIVVLLIMNIGWIMNASFEVPYLLGNGIVMDVSQTIDIFVLKYGITNSNYSMATAAGIFKSVIALSLVAFTNFLSKKFSGEAIL